MTTRELRLLAFALAACLGTEPAAAQLSDPNWRILSPATTGICGSDTTFAVVDANDDYWVAGRYPFWSDGGAARYDGALWETLSNVDTPMPSQHVYSIAFGQDGVRWYGTGAGLVRQDGDDWQVFDSSNSPLPTDDVINLVVEDSGVVWMKYFKSGGWLTKGVARFDGSSWQVWDRTELGFAVASDFTGPVIDGQGRVFVGSTTGGTSQSGMAIFDGHAWTLSNASNGTSNAAVGRLRTDPNGDIWCFWWMGVQKLVGESWVSMPNPPTTDSIASFEPRTGTEYWVGTHSGFLLEYDGSQWTQHAPGGPTFPSWVLGIDWDSGGNQWVLTLKAGVWRLDASTGVWNQFTSQNTGMAGYFVDDIETDSDGRPWFAMGGAGAAQLLGAPGDFHDAEWRCFNAANSGSDPWPWDFSKPYGNDSANDVHSDGQGGVWISSSGVGHFDGQGFDQLYVSQNSNIWTNSGDGQLALDTGGSLWVAYDLYGVDRFDGATWTHFSTSNGLPGNFVEELVSDGQGGVWAATNGGAAHFDGASWTTLPTPPGLPFSITAIDVGQDGSVWVGTSAGVARWDGAAWSAVYTVADGLPPGWVNDIEAAPNGDVWVGAFDAQLWPYRGGASRFDGQSWTLFDSTNSPLPHEQVEAVHVDAQGNVYLSAMSEGVAVLLAETPLVCQPDLGSGGPGAVELSVCGEPLGAGQQALISIAGAAPGSPAFLLLGPSQGAVHFAGGILVPSPTSLVGPLGTDGSGSLELTLTGVGTPLDAVLQVVVLDLAQPQLFAISNAVLVQFL